MIGLLPHSLITEEEIASVKTLRDGTVYMVSSPFASVRGIFGVQLPLEGASMRVLHSIRGEATPLNLAFRGFVWVIPARNRIVKLSWNSAGR